MAEAKKFKCLIFLMSVLFILNCMDIYAAPDPSKVNNIAPTIDLNVTPAKKPVDIVILTDYTGTKLSALNTRINALKAQFAAVNVDPVFHIVSDVKKVGIQNDELYYFRRYGRFFYKVSDYKRYHEYGLEEHYAPHTLEETVEWEEIQALKSQYTNLPVRNPLNVTFTKSVLQTYKSINTTKKWYDITIKCTNDVKNSGMAEEEIYRKSIGGQHNEYVYGSILSEYAEVDSKWTMEEKVSDISYDIYSFDFDKLDALPLRAGSDRHMIFLSDATAKDYSKTFGNYFSFGDMTDTLKNYINTNKFSLYGVVPTYTRDRTLLPDKVLKILPLGDTTLFYMRNGDVMQLGDIELASTLTSGSDIYPAKTTDIGEVKDKIDLSRSSYLLMEDGTVKCVDSTSNAIVTVEGLANITKLYYHFSLYALDGSGKIYKIATADNGVEPFNNTVAITDIVNVQNNNIYLTASGVPYIEYRKYDSTLKVSTDNLLRRLQIKTVDEEADTETLSYMPALKDAEYFSARAELNAIKPMLFLYTTGKIQQFLRFDSDTIYSGINDRYRTYVDYVLYEENSILETGVKSIESSNTSIFIYKNDGTVKMLNTDWVEASGYDDDDHRITYLKPVVKNTTVSVPLTNIQETHRTEHDYYFLTDSNNDTYIYNGTYQGLQPITGTTMTNLGKVIKIDEITISNYKNIFILYENGTVRRIRYWKNLYELNYNHNLTDTLLPYTNIKDICASNDDIYLLKGDGYVLGMGSTSYGQLGTKDGTVTTFRDPFATTLTFDTTKTYYSLLDIFNESANGVFYPAGGYAAALNAIYNKYGSYSGTGNMYVVLGEDIKYESVYDDYESDPEHSRKWLISHDPYYFDNSMGLSIYNNPAGFTTSPPVKLDKVGKYVINLKARDNPKADNRFNSYRLWSLGDQNLTVYIHRKPVALLRITVNNNGDGTFTVKAFDAGSYDLDHSNSRTDRGITASEWRWKESTAAAWTTVQMNKADCSPEKSYIIQLRVKDVEGVWSDYTTITIDRNNPPIALFSLDKTVIRNTEALKVKDQSFPQSFSGITDWHWVVKKLNADGSVPGNNIQNAQFTTSNAGTGALAGYDANVKTSYSANGTGTFRVYLRVKDSNGLWSDGGTDSTIPSDPGKYYSTDFVVDKAPTASFTIANNPMEPMDILKLKDTSTINGVSAINRWHWIVKKLNSDGSVPGISLQDSQYATHNAGTGALAGYDDNVKTDYSANGAGTYRIYLRAMNANGMWSDGGADGSINLGSFFYRDLVVEESFKIADFRVVKVKDLHLESYYYNSSTGQYDDRPMGVNTMAIDRQNFGGIVDGLTKGYLFEFEIDTVNFNDNNDAIIITPHFFTCDSYGRDRSERDLYWENSYHEILKAGEGGHAVWAAIRLGRENRTIKGENKATWRGSYLIPGTAWAVPGGTAADNAFSNRINRDIIVNFEIKGYKDAVMRFDYNLKQWPLERTAVKQPYEVGDVIRYSFTKCNLDDNNVILNRP